MNIYEQMKLWRMERDEMEHVCKETRENCCMRYTKKDANGNRLIEGCKNCPLFYTAEESCDISMRNISGKRTAYRCMANKPLKEFYDFITKEAEE